jgi:hypothetical protein
MLNLVIPLWARVATLASLAVACFCFGWTQGANHVQAKWDKASAKQQVLVVRVKDQQTAINDQVGAAHVAQQEKTRTVFRDRVVYRDREIPHEVIVRDDAACVVPEYFVSLWNSANRGELPDAASVADGRPSAVVLSDITAQKDRESELCLGAIAKVERFKQWAREQHALSTDQRTAQ